MKISNSISSFCQKTGETIVAKKPLSKFASKYANFTNQNPDLPMLLGVMLAGVLAPRLIQAQDDFDREEIFRRDVITIGTIALGAPILKKTLSKVCEKATGFALAFKPEGFDSKGVGKKILSYLNPEGGVQVLSSKQIESHYSNVKDASSLCEFVSEHKGNLKKFFSTTDETKSALTSLLGKEGFEKADNKSILKAIKDGVAKGASDDVKNAVQNLTKVFNENSGKFVQKAKTMNSSFGFFATFLAIPVCLGILLPKMNEKITKAKIAQKIAAKQQQSNSQPVVPNSQASSQPGQKSNFVPQDDAKAKEVFKAFVN